MGYTFLKDLPDKLNKGYCYISAIYVQLELPFEYHKQGNRTKKAINNENLKILKEHFEPAYIIPCYFNRGGNDNGFDSYHRVQSY